MFLTHFEVSLSSAMDLIQANIYPAILELREELGEEIQEVHEQLAKQSSRLEELHVKKSEEPGMHLVINNLNYYSG